TVKAQSFRMSWCMDCHKDPAQYIRPKDQVFNMAWEPGSADAKSTLEALKFASQRELGEHLIEEYNVEVEQMTNCSICHR
ncbi:MAG: cytochrome C, partial [Candidatus Hydrogenedentota bacterium]